MRRLHRGSTSFRTGRTLRRARGISLVVTVLLTMLAATIGLVVVRQSVLSTREESGRLDYGRAQVALDEVQTQFERQLASNPTFYLTSTFAYERPRLCGAVPDELTPSVAVSIESNPWLIPSKDAAGQMQSAVWPCGDSWSYPQVAQQIEGWQWTVPGQAVRVGVTWRPEEFPVRAEVFPPTPAEPTLRLKAMATVGGQETGIIVAYSRSAASEWSVYSSTDLNMSAALGPASAPVEQTVILGPGASTYSGGVTYLPTGFEEVRGSTLLAEGGFVGQAGEEGNRLVTVPEIRNSVTSPLSMSSLRASAASLSEAGCPPVIASSVCLEAGQVLKNTDGDDVQVPTASAYLLLPSGDLTSPSIRVLAAPSELVYVSECDTECSPRSASVSLVQAGVHPAVLPEVGASPWVEVGTFPYPDTGVVAADADVYVGACPESILAGAGCAAATFPASLTVWAGSLSTSADIFVSSSVGVGEGFRLALVASGQVKVAYWAGEDGSDVEVGAALVSMGFGEGDASAVGAVPEARPGAVITESMGVVVTGSIAGESVERPESLTQVRVLPQPLFATGAPPYMPGFSHTLQSVGSEAVSSLDVCPEQLGQPSPSGGTRSTCLGVW